MAIVPIVLQNTNRNRSAFAATSSTRRRLSTLVSNSGDGSRSKTRVDDAVEHHVAVGHRCAQRFLVGKVAVAAFDVQIVDRHSRAGLTEKHSYIVTPLDELASDMRSDETAGAHHEDFTSAG